MAERVRGLSGKTGEKWIPVLDKDRDEGSVDLLTRALPMHDRMAWMLRRRGGREGSGIEVSPACRADRFQSKGRWRSAIGSRPTRLRSRGR